MANLNFRRLGQCSCCLGEWLVIHYVVEKWENGTPHIRKRDPPPHSKWFVKTKFFSKLLVLILHFVLFSGDSLSRSLVNYVTNFFAVVWFHALINWSTIHYLVSDTLDQLMVYAGWVWDEGRMVWTGLCMRRSGGYKTKGGWSEWGYVWDVVVGMRRREDGLNGAVYET